MKVAVIFLIFIVGRQMPILFKLYFFTLKKYFIYLFMRETERGGDIGRGRSRLPVGEPDLRLNPRTPGIMT